jgi:hypothetical protein
MQSIIKEITTKEKLTIPQINKNWRVTDKAALSINSSKIILTSVVPVLTLRHDFKDLKDYAIILL